MRTNTRSGFTLIELMVAMALTLFVMVILSQAFIMSLETFSNMKGIGDMQNYLRVTTTLLKDDLGNDHIEGKRRLSELLTPTGGTFNPLIVTQPPQAGFLAVRRSSTVGSGSYVFEGNDANGMASFRAVDQMLYMTVKRKGNRQENFFTTALVDPNPPPAFPAKGLLENFFSVPTAYNLLPIPNPGSLTPDLPTSTYANPYAPRLNAGSPYVSTAFYSSQWAEVLYYLIRTGSTEEPTNPLSPLGTPTFGLYRVQFPMVPDRTNLNAGGFPNAALNTFFGLSCNQGAGGSLVFFSPGDSAQPTMPNRVIWDFSPLGFDTSADVIGPGNTLMSIGAGNTLVPPPAFNQRVFAGATLVCPDVVSFHVQVMPLTAPGVPAAFQDVLPNINMATGGNFTWGVYDTSALNPTAPGFASSANNRMGLKGVQVTIRVWDAKSRQTRQSTVVNDL